MMDPDLMATTESFQNTGILGFLWAFLLVYVTFDETKEETSKIKKTN
jgi:hypothetical protein